MARGAYAEMFKAERARLVAEGKGRQEGRLFIVEQPSKNERHPGYVHLRIWRGNQSKPFVNYLMKPEAAVQEIQRQVDSEKQSQAVAAKWAAEKAARVSEMRKMPVGTILHGSWGYDQTNCELYEVVGRPSAGFAEIRELATESVPGSEGFMACQLRPLPGQYVGPVVKVLIGKNGIKLHEHCHLSPTDPQRTHYSSWYA